MLIGQFWGTSDATAIPSPYCNCEVCKEAREKGGKYVRTRSCFRLSDEVMIMNFLRFDMSEYSTEIDVTKLNGVAPGYVGFEQAGALTTQKLGNSQTKVGNLFHQLLIVVFVVLYVLCVVCHI